ncbi:MAG: hypothetical protein IPO48_04345 [Saprospiraceae bacterium]|nr:hypothetical protein [Saprospiraceae bacterium]
MKIHIKFTLGFIILFLEYLGQTVIFTNGGASYNNIDNTQATFPVVDNYGPIDISNCTSVRFSMNFNFSDPWSGNPRMESPETCFAGGCTCIARRFFGMNCLIFGIS